MIVYIYGLIDPREELIIENVRYVGKTKNNINRRLSQHVENSKTYEQELADDLISIIHYFSMKSYSNRRKLNKIKSLLLEKNDIDDNT
jgi:predicted site-specific integrase-resolvase